MLWTQFCIALGSFDIASGVVYPFFFFPLVLRRSNCEFGYGDVTLGVESGGQGTAVLLTGGSGQFLRVW
jgi:hypothetical protein